MKLPERIPKRLRNMAVSFPGFGEGEGAWSRDDAIEVLESLKGTVVAVAGVAVFDHTTWGYAPSDVGLSIDRRTNESDADYARRSRQAAADFIRTADDSWGDRLYALAFPLWKDAA